MTGRNFWVYEQADGWEVRQEGIPDKNRTFASKEEAWAFADAGARDCHGEAFVSDGRGSYTDRVCHRVMPEKMKP